MSEDITIRVTGVGSGSTVQVEDGSTVAEALRSADINGDPDTLDIRVDGASVEDAGSVRLSQASNVTVVPKKPALG